MKHLLLIIVFSFVASLGVSAYAQDGFINHFVNKKEIPLRPIKLPSQNGGVLRSPSLQYAVAFISEKTVVVDCLYPMDNITITITDINTGAILHSGFYVSLDNAVIVLNSDEANCCIEIISESWTLRGTFSLLH